MEKLKQWMEIAKNMQGGEFWDNIFDQDFTRQFLNDQPYKASSKESKDPQSSNINTSSATFPPIELLEGDQEVCVIIELPGIKKEDIELNLAGNQLTIKGTSKPLYPHLKRVSSERFYGEFQRKVHLPDKVEPNKLTAKFWNGLLFVSYPRSVTKVEIISVE